MEQIMSDRKNPVDETSTDSRAPIIAEITHYLTEYSLEELCQKRDGYLKCSDLKQRRNCSLSISRLTLPEYIALILENAGFEYVGDLISFSSDKLRELGFMTDEIETIKGKLELLDLGLAVTMTNWQRPTSYCQHYFNSSCPTNWWGVFILFSL
jgi:DNA-directed RNA polymerase alpha subunit